MTLKMAAFILLLMGFDGGKMVIHYFMICDHEMVDYCVISKGLVSQNNQSCCRVSYRCHRQFIDGSHGGFVGEIIFRRVGHGCWYFWSYNANFDC
jgi:hypothetical protein